MPFMSTFSEKVNAMEEHIACLSAHTDMPGSYQKRSSRESCSQEKLKRNEILDDDDKVSFIFPPHPEVCGQGVVCPSAYFAKVFPDMGVFLKPH